MLPMPDLDDRRFQDLVDEAKRRIPTYCPEWTDHNVSDPGITLIELFAGMVETLIYRLNRVPEKNYIALMNLIGLRLMPPEPARIDLTFWLSAPATAPVTIPAGTELETGQRAEDVKGSAPSPDTTERPAWQPIDEPVRFSTDDAFVIYPPETRACMTSADEVNFDDRTRSNAAGTTPFAAFPNAPQPGDALYLCDANDLSNHVLRVSIRVNPVDGIGVKPECPPVVWEAWCGTRWDRCDWENDTTKALNIDGTLTLFLPPGMKERFLGGVNGYWIRCRHLPDPPDIPGYEKSPQIKQIACEAIGAMVAASHATIITNELLGVSNGGPGQVFRLEYHPILGPRLPDEYIEVQRPGSGEWVAWQERADFYDSRPPDTHYVIDDVSGEVRFGPLIREPSGVERQYGARPPEGSRIRMRRYRHGGGALTVGASRDWFLRGTVAYVDRVTNRFPSRGGRDAETLEHAMLRAPREVRTSERAVTATDFETLALRASRQVYRAACVMPGALRPGERPNPVRVLIVPRIDQPNGHIAPEALAPGPLATEVKAYLDQRRLLTTVVQVEAPRYIKVRVVATLRVAPGASRAAVYDAALARLYRFLNPITGGPDGDGWPFGRDLFLTDVYAQLQAVASVALIERIVLYADDVSREKEQMVEVGEYALIISGEHKLTVQPHSATGRGR